MRFIRLMTTAFLVLSLFAVTSCLNSTDVKIGVIIPEEGSLAAYGYQIRSGIQLANEEINARADLKKKYELIFENESLQKKILNLQKDLEVHKDVEEELAKRSHLSKGIIKKLTTKIA